MTESQVPKVYPPVSGEATIEFNDPREGGNYGDTDEYWMIWNNYFDLRMRADGTAMLSASGGSGEGLTYEYPLDEVAIDALRDFLSHYRSGGRGWDKA